MWTSNIKIWIKTDSQWREAIVFVKTPTEWRPSTGFIRVGTYEQVPIIPLQGLSLLPSVRGSKEVSIQSLESARRVTIAPSFFPASIQSLNPVIPIVTSNFFREVAIRLLPATISISVEAKPW